ncbi:asparagine synthase-related protein [Parerythrobacter jejuensis]|uniref:asparagine synthase-related protein n=1 Tax=Parerythrobacter jejuensis TaxID=795812 RepID=UPI001371D306|nr:asparagine synthase-related protein [Parerythrobacter jejuensis]
MTSDGAVLCQWGPGNVPIEANARVLLYGAIDNAQEIQAQLGLPRDASNAATYLSAVEAWGDAADTRIIGTYAAIIREGTTGIRISRSPWKAPPLFWTREKGRLLVSASPRLIFSAGYPKRLAAGRYAEMLYWIEPDPGAYWYEGLHKCPQGTIIHLSGECDRQYQWYTPASLPEVRLTDDREYVEAASGLLSDAVRASLAPSQKPGILLGGGLDSSLVAEEMLQQLQPGKFLESFTFTPHRDWRGHAPEGLFADDRPWVEGFAATRPQLNPHFCDNDGHDFDSLMEKLVLASGIFRPSTMISSVFDGPALQARQAGCDWLFDAGLGNNTFSNDGRWAYVEFLKQGKLRELWAMLRDQPGDTRSMPRRFLARSVLMLLPEKLRQAARIAVHGQPQSLSRDFSLLRKDAIRDYCLEDLARRRGDSRTGEWFRSREQWLEFVWRNCDYAPEMHTACEEVYGLRMRDVTAYRPLIEFCAGIPTEQFVRAGRQRWLARRMAQGRLPEDQRHNTNYGMHHADWHLRMSRRLPELRAELSAIKEDEELDALIDVERGLERIDNWPANTSHDLPTMQRHFHAIGGAVLTARYKRIIEGKNR